MGSQEFVWKPLFFTAPGLIEGNQWEGLPATPQARSLPFAKGGKVSLECSKFNQRLSWMGLAEQRGDGSAEGIRSQCTGRDRGSGGAILLKINE